MTMFFFSLARASKVYYQTSNQYYFFFHYKILHPLKMILCFFLQRVIFKLVIVIVMNTLHSKNLEGEINTCFQGKTKLTTSYYCCTTN
jgi:hypothetical protein